MKAKKERRKQRKLSTHTIPPEGDTCDNPVDFPPGKTSALIDLAQLTARSSSVAESDSKKRKKRKLDHLVEEDSEEDHQPTPVDADGPNIVDGPESSHALPLFPLPTHPDAPSKTELALQGLNKAQIEAELVDPNYTFSIDLGIDSDKSALGLKTRKRLIDLGINELFAGTSYPFAREVLLVAKVEQFRRPLFHFCLGPSTNTLAFTTRITHPETCVSRPRLVAGRRSHTPCQSLK